eukprot:ctg_1038.g377
MLPVDERGSDGGGRQSSGGAAPVLGSGERAHNFAFDCVAGGVAGLVADLMMHPLDTIKARLQAQVSMRYVAGGREGASEYRPRPYRGVWDCALRVYREQGMRRGLYAGLSAVLLGSVPASALTFGSYKLIKSVLPGEEAWMGGGGSAWWRDLAAASVADVAALVTYVPAEVVAKRLQVAGMGPARDYTSPLQALRVIARTEGIWRGVYAGTQGAAGAVRLDARRPVALRPGSGRRSGRRHHPAGCGEDAIADAADRRRPSLHRGVAVPAHHCGTGGTASTVQRHRPAHTLGSAGVRHHLVGVRVGDTVAAAATLRARRGGASHRGGARRTIARGGRRREEVRP